MTTVPNSIRIGGMEKPALLRALRDHGVQLNKAAQQLFDDSRFVPATQTDAVPIATTSVAELGLRDGATYAALIARALEVGFTECPLELAAHLRLQYTEQPEVAEPSQRRDGAPPGSITVASPRLDDADETPKGFYLRRIDGVLWLRGYWADADHVWQPDAVFVFRRLAAHS